MTREAEKSTRGFEAARGRLFKLAYRMPGSIGDAEDAVQDLYLRWTRAGDGVKTPKPGL